MTWGAVATVGGSLLSGYVASDSANSAADAQTASAQAGIEQQNQRNAAVQKLLSPYSNAATSTGNYQPISQADLIDTTSGTWKPNAELYANSPQYRAAWDKYQADHVAQYGSAPRNGSTVNIGNAYQAIAKNGFDLNAYNQQNAGKPTAMGSLPAQQNLLGLNGADAQRAAINGIADSPMFAALQQQGENAILQNASATGGLRGGNTQGALAQFRPQLLNQLIDQQYQRLGGLTSLGQNAAAGVGNAGLATGNQITALLGQQGAAQAGAALAGGRANAQMVNGLASGIGSYVGSGGFGGSTAPVVDTPSNIIF